MVSRIEPALRHNAGRRRLPPGMIAGLAAWPAAAFVWAWLRLGLPRPFCPLRAWTGVPCPTCGTTRLLEALASGDVLSALAWNPWMFAALLAGAAWTAASTARWALGLPAGQRRLSPRARRALIVLGAALLAANWLYLVWRMV